MKKMLLTCSLAVVTLLNADLRDDAIKAGLKPIPESKTELLKLIDNPKNPITDLKVKLGKKLYIDPRLSKSGWISCNSCHNLFEGGDDGLEAAIGHKWTQNPHHLNSPTVYNAVFNSSQFWDGRAKDLEEQAQGPIQAAPEMAATPEHVEKVVNSIPEYVKCFKKAYGDDVKITFKLVADTIATFERTLVTPSRYDAFLNGHSKALNKKEKEGLKTFIKVGCVNCHNGIALGGGMNYFNFKDYKYNKVGDFKGDKSGLVKVPTLRNIAQTAPYFHNGMVKTLPKAVKEMAKIQLGKNLSKKDVENIVAFLKSLTGKKPKLSKLQLPPSTPKTPKPDIN